MTSIRTLIVDDEPLARTGVRKHLRAHADVDVIGECGSGVQAIAAIQQDQPDLVFLDIQMPDLGGFGVIEEIGADRMPAVIFVTAFDQFALQAFESRAVDYLLKPIRQERVDQALTRIRGLMRGHESGRADTLRKLLDDLGAEAGYRKRFVAKSGSRITLVNVEDVDWIEAADNYIELHAGPKVHLVRETLSDVEQKLNPDQFLRIRHSTIVNVSRIREMEPLFNGEYQIRLTNGSELTSSRRYRKKLSVLLGD
ncbi:MAG: LytTR family DNA-binding domain-containing protein [Bryobacteraceae bacterium]